MQRRLKSGTAKIEYTDGGVRQGIVYDHNGDQYLLWFPVRAKDWDSGAFVGKVKWISDDLAFVDAVELDENGDPTILRHILKADKASNGVVAQFSTTYRREDDDQDADTETWRVGD